MDFEVIKHTERSGHSTVDVMIKPKPIPVTDPYDHRWRIPKGGIAALLKPNPNDPYHGRRIPEGQKCGLTKPMPKPDPDDPNPYKYFDFMYCRSPVDIDDINQPDLNLGILLRHKSDILERLGRTFVWKYYKELNYLLDIDYFEYELKFCWLSDPVWVQTHITKHDCDNLRCHTLSELIIRLALLGFDTTLFADVTEKQARYYVYLVENFNKTRNDHYYNYLQELSSDDHKLLCAILIAGGLKNTEVSIIPRDKLYETLEMDNVSSFRFKYGTQIARYEELSKFGDNKLKRLFGTSDILKVLKRYPKTTCVEQYGLWRTGRIVKKLGIIGEPEPLIQYEHMIKSYGPAAQSWDDCYFRSPTYSIGNSTDVELEQATGVKKVWPSREQYTTILFDMGCGHKKFYYSTSTDSDEIVEYGNNKEHITFNICDIIDKNDIFFDPYRLTELYKLLEVKNPKSELLPKFKDYINIKAKGWFDNRKE